MTPQQLLNDQRWLFRDLPRETITINGEEFECLCFGARHSDEVQLGGFSATPQLEIVIERNAISASQIPETGDSVTFRAITYRVGEVFHDHPQSPIRFFLENVAK